MQSNSPSVCSNLLILISLRWMKHYFDPYTNTLYFLINVIRSFHSFVKCKQKDFISKELYVTVVKYWISCINPLWIKFFSSFFETYPNIGSFRLPTHRRDAHRKFFWWSLLKIEFKFWSNFLYLGLWATEG